MCYVAIRDALDAYNDAGEKAAKPKRASKKKADDKEAKDAKDTAVSSIEVDSQGHKRPVVWLYRGAWQEWEIYKADVFMPMSKADLDRKIEAIFKHESQKDRALFPGAYDEREFWQRARDRNTGTALELNSLGLPEFYAVEAYVLADRVPS